MAEALGIAGSVVSFVGLAGQVAQGINYLYNFFNSMQDAPSDIKSLATELKILGTILDEVNRDVVDSAALRAALQLCEDIIAELDGLVQKSNLTSKQSKVKRLWSQMSTTFRNEEFRKYIERLERAKTSLLHAKMSSHGSMHQQELSGIRMFQESLAKSSLEHSEAAMKTTEAVRLTQSELQNLSSRMKGVVMGEISTTMAKSHATCSKILTELRESSLKTDQTNEELKLAIQSLLSDNNTSIIATLLQPALEKAISDQIASSMEALTTHLRRSHPETLNTPTFHDAEVSAKELRKPAKTEVGEKSLNQLSATKTCMRWAGTSRVIKFWFGRLILSTSALDSWEGHGDGKTLQKVEFLETKATLIPSKWLLRKGVVLKITRLVSAVVAPSIQFSLTPIMVISEDNEIVGAMRHGDLTKVQQLILGGKVHPSSMFPCGSTLVHYCIKDLPRHTFEGLEFWEMYEDGFLLSFEGEEFRPGDMQPIFKLIDVAAWLVTYGSGTDIPNIHGESAFFELAERHFCEWSASNYGVSTPERLENLAILMLRASSSSPLFARDQRGQPRPTETLSKQWEGFLPMLARSFSSDVSTSLCLKTLQLLWDSTPYCQDHELFENADLHPDRDTAELCRAAIAGKIWLAGDPHVSENCAHLLYRSIRGALVRASPYFRPKNRPLYSPDRSNIANAVEDMLRIDTDISTYTKGSESLTACALRWRCLDIWKDALEKSGCEPLSSTIWENNACFYDLSGFTSCGLGTSVRVVDDAAAQKVILVIDEWQGIKEHYWSDWETDPELKSFTEGLPCFIKLLRVHCEVYPSQPIDIHSADNSEHETLTSDNHTSTPGYKVQQTEDGGIELFIDCCELDEPWKRLCAEVRREQGFADDESSEGSNDSGSRYSCGDSEAVGDHDEGDASTGIFPKIAGFGLDILSAFV